MITMERKTLEHRMEGWKAELRYWRPIRKRAIYRRVAVKDLRRTFGKML